MGLENIKNIDKVFETDNLSTSYRTNNCFVAELPEILGLAGTFPLRSLAVSQVFPPVVRFSPVFFGVSISITSGWFQSMLFIQSDVPEAMLVTDGCRHLCEDKSFIERQWAAGLLKVVLH